MLNKIYICNKLIINIIQIDNKSKGFLLEDGSIKRGISGNQDNVEITCISCDRRQKIQYITQTKNGHLNKQYECFICRSEGKRNPFYGKKHTKELKKRRSKERKGTWFIGEKNGMYGKTNFDIWKEKFGIEEANRLESIRLTNLSIACMGEKNGFYGKRHSNETKAILCTATTQFMNSPEGKASCLKGGLASVAKKGRKTRPEKLVEEWLIKNNILYRYNFISTQYQYDFRILDTNIIIEVQGDFWHANPEIYPDRSKLRPRQIFKIERDKIKLQYALDKGWKILYIWEAQINRNDFSSLDGLTTTK